MDALSAHERAIVVSDLNDLLRLDLDAVLAYDETMRRLDDATLATHVGIFRDDHVRHVGTLKALIEQMGGHVQERPHASAPLKRALVAAGAVGGDKGVLMGFRANELQSRAKYDRYAARELFPREVQDIVRTQAMDDHRHYEWVTRVLDGSSPG